MGVGLGAPWARGLPGMGTGPWELQDGPRGTAAPASAPSPFRLHTGPFFFGLFHFRVHIFAFPLPIWFPRVQDGSQAQLWLI